MPLVEALRRRNMEGARGNRSMSAGREGRECGARPFADRALFPQPDRSSAAARPEESNGTDGRSPPSLARSAARAHGFLDDEGHERSPTACARSGGTHRELSVLPPMPRRQAARHHVRPHASGRSRRPKTADGAANPRQCGLGGDAAARIWLKTGGRPRRPEDLRLIQEEQRDGRETDGRDKPAVRLRFSHSGQTLSQLEDTAARLGAWCCAKA